MSKTHLPEIDHYLALPGHNRAFLATLDASGFPQVRPITVMVHGGSFYFATCRSSRKGAQISKDNRVEFVIPFREGEFTGYLRVMGLADEVADAKIAKEVTTACSYPVWTAFDDPDFFFFRVVPTRVEYMKPGEDNATEVTDEYIQ